MPFPLAVSTPWRSNASAHSNAALAARRECIVEGEGRQSSRSSTQPIGEEFKFLKNTRWNWNNWRDVIFRGNGEFLAPAEGCEQEGNPKCKWWSDDDFVYVNFGGAGLHKLQPDGEQTTLFGAREKDGDEVRATRR